MDLFCAVLLLSWWWILTHLERRIQLGYSICPSLLTFQSMMKNRLRDTRSLQLLLSSLNSADFWSCSKKKWPTNFYVLSCNFFNIFLFCLFLCRCLFILAILGISSFIYTFYSLVFCYVWSLHLPWWRCCSYNSGPLCCWELNPKQRQSPSPQSGTSNRQPWANPHESDWFLLPC